MDLTFGSMVTQLTALDLFWFFLDSTCAFVKLGQLHIYRLRLLNANA